MMKPAINASAWAIGKRRRYGFHVRRVVWGLTLAREERREDEEIRAATILVEDTWKRRHAQPKEKSRSPLHDAWATASEQED